MLISSINCNNCNLFANKKLPNYQLFLQKPDVVSFSAKRAFSFSDKGILQTAIDECENREAVNSLLKDNEGVYKYQPFTVFEILTQRNKPNFEENLRTLQQFKTGNASISPYGISKILAACDGQDVKPRLDLIVTTKEKGIKIPFDLLCVDNTKFKEIKKHLEKINDTNKRSIIAKCYAIAKPDIDRPITDMSAEERLLVALFGEKKPKKDDLEKLIEKGKYKNISIKELTKYKKEHYDNYLELYEKSKLMPQILDLINHIIGLGKYSKHKDSWIRKELKSGLKFEDVASIFLQMKSPDCNVELGVLNNLLFGQPSRELKTRIKEFTKRTGIHLHTDNNIPISYIDRFEKMVPALNNHYSDNSNIAGAGITTIIEGKAGGLCYNYGIWLSPLRSDFEGTVFHEYAHVAHKRCVPRDIEKNQGRLDAWNDLINRKFFPKDSIEYKTTVAQLNDYATTDFAEFVAVLNEKVGIGEFEVVLNEKGEKVLRKYLKDGDTTTAKDLEILMDIYKSAYGPDIGVTKASSSTSAYVETPFKGTPKFDYLAFMCQNAQKEFS